MKKKFKQPKVKALMDLMVSVGVLCEVVRTMKEELRKEGFTDDDLCKLEEITGQDF
jgi:hypothetical protein